LLVLSPAQSDNSLVFTIGSKIRLGNFVFTIKDDLYLPGQRSDARKSSQCDWQTFF
jgi:hypothetical protein